jgi:L-threonylcarbamoyladenylate synthase
MALISTDEAISQLKAGAVVGIPTETVYGLAAVIGDESALRQIFAVKKRPFFDPLIIHTLNLEQARLLFFDLPPVLEDLAINFWPGPLTLVATRKSHINSLITSGLPTVAVRVPSHPIARSILKATGPLAAPSANRFGKTSPTTAAHVISEFDDSIHVVDGGNCEVGLESTVVELAGHELIILRPGRVLVSDIEKIAAKYKVDVRFGSSKASPGNLKHHYQPEVPLVLLNSELTQEELIRKVTELLNRHDILLQFLTLPENPSEAARVLYAELRRLSGNPKNVIIAKPKQWNWQGDSTDLFDRLTRASSFIL